MAVIIDGTNGITSPGETLTGTQVLAAGTTSIAPLDFTSGTLLTTPLAGAMEYDGKVIYATPQSTERGVVPGAQFFRLNAGLVGANATGAQNALGVGVTLSASTVYQYEAFLVMFKTAGSTSHNMSFGFGGTATNNNILTAISALEVTGGSGVNQAGYLSYWINTTAATVVTGAMGAASKSVAMKISGTISINAGGTLIPQYTLSAAPGGAYTTQAGSYFLIYPIGASGANTSVGTWA
jgi:hypothetical protein